jgi:hypothetical protein
MHIASNLDANCQLFPNLKLVHSLIPSRSQAEESFNSSLPGASTDSILDDESPREQEVSSRVTDYEWLLGQRGPFDEIDAETMQIKHKDQEKQQEEMMLYSLSPRAQPTVPTQKLKWTLLPKRNSPASEAQYEHSRARKSDVQEIESSQVGVLDLFASKDLYSRRSSESLKKSDNPLHIYSPEQPTPRSLQELYSLTLPNVRSKLRQEGLRQVGFITPLRQLNAANALSTEELFYKNRYKRMKVDPNSYRYNPFNPVAYEDASLYAFSPKEWTGNYPPPAQDDLLQHAIQNLRTEFKILPNIVYKKQSAQNPVPSVRYLFTVKGNKKASSEDIGSIIHLQLQIIVSHPASGKTLSQLERHIDVRNNVEVVSGELSVLSRTDLVGSFRVIARVFLIEETDGEQQEDSERNKLLLASHLQYFTIINSQ